MLVQGSQLLKFKQNVASTSQIAVIQQMSGRATKFYEVNKVLRSVHSKILVLLLAKERDDVSLSNSIYY